MIDPSTLKDKPYVRLNLGCGNKIYPRKEGWVNVDAVGKNVDIQCDVRDMKSVVGKHVADEIHAYHLIEHFYKEEVPLILKNWYDVLKPGGHIYLEAPDVRKCAYNFFLGMLKNDVGQALTLGIKGFYGDVDSKSPTREFDLHKWGWFYDSLSEQLSKAGFENIEEQEAITHMKKDRDFRIYAQKPLQSKSEQQLNKLGLKRS